MNVGRLRRTRVDRIRHDRQRLIVHFDQMQCLLRYIGVVRSDECDRITHITRGLVLTNQYRPVKRDDAMGIFSRDVRPGEHRVHARQGAGAGGVDASYYSVRVCRAQGAAVDHVREIVIIRVLRPPGDAIDDIGHQFAAANAFQWLIDCGLVGG